MSLDHFDPDAAATGDGLFGLPHGEADAAVVVVPVPFEATASYRRGTKGAPAAIARASLQVDLHDLETGEPWRAGIAMQATDPDFERWEREATADATVVIARGGVDRSDADLVARCARVDAVMEQMNDRLHARVAALLDHGKIPAVVGGDHSVPFGAMRAAADRHRGLGVLHIDAHADLREAYEGFTWSHASILRNVATRMGGIEKIVQVGIRDMGRAERAFAEDRADIDCWYHPQVAWELAGGEPWQRVANRMIAPLPDRVWVTFDIDGLDPALCPATGTPVPGGLTWIEACTLLRVVVESGRTIVGFDLTEVGDAEWDAIVGARLLYKLAGWAILSRNGAA